MEEVGKGHDLGMKCLFEMVGLYPAIAAADVPVEDSVGRDAAAKAGFWGRANAAIRVTKDSTSATAESEDVLK